MVPVPVCDVLADIMVLFIVHILLYILASNESQVLLEAPVGTGLGIVMGITGMGANDFMDFLLSYFVDLGLIMLFRVNVDPALGDILEAVGGM